jgi:hypothetical protein
MKIFSALCTSEPAELSFLSLYTLPYEDTRSPFDVVKFETDPTYIQTVALMF